MPIYKWMKFNNGENMRQTIWRKGSFASCHRIMNHKGKCKNLHGHNYNYELGIGYEINQNTKFNECNYMIDFGELKTVFQKWIDTFFDHSVIVNENDKDVIELAKKINDPTRVLLTKGDPSVEVISQMILYLCYRVTNSLNVVKTSNVTINYIRIYETDNSYCEIDAREESQSIQVSKQFIKLLDKYL